MLVLIDSVGSHLTVLSSMGSVSDEAREKEAEWGVVDEGSCDMDEHWGVGKL